MKRSVKDHEDMLENIKYSLNKAREELSRTSLSLAGQVRRMEMDVELLSLQIQEAKKRGMTEFDNTRLLKPRGKYETK